MRLLTRIYHRQGRSSEAKDIAEKCLDLSKRNNLELEFAKTLGNLAIIESYFGNKRQALRLMQKFSTQDDGTRKSSGSCKMSP